MSDYHSDINVGNIAKQKVIDAEHLKQTISDLCEDWHCLLLDKDIVLSIIDMEPEAEHFERSKLYGGMP